jgi:hypothetical protein
MLSVNEFNFRLTDHIDFGGIAIIPVVVGLRFRYHTRIADNLHLGLVNDNFLAFAGEVAGAHLLYPVVSLGVPSQHLNYGVGYVFSYSSFNNRLQPFFSLGGSVQFAPHWRLMGNFFYLFQEAADNVTIPQVMFSHHRFRHRYDFGIVPLFDTTFPFLPVFSYSLYF